MFRESFFKSKGVHPPLAQPLLRTTQYHGEERIDPYAWLRERDNPRVSEYLEAENSYTAQTTTHVQPLQDMLYDEMLSRVREDDMTPPDRDGDYFYYTKTEKGKQYQIHCRRKGNMEGKEEVVLDENVLAMSHTFFHIGAFQVSPDHALLAYTVDTTGSEEHDLFFRVIATGELLSDVIARVSDFEWVDNTTYFVTLMNAARCADKLARGSLGGALTVVYEEQDPLFYLDLGKSKEDKYILPSRASKDTSEVWLIPAAAPLTPMQSVYGLHEKVQYIADTREDIVYIIVYGSTPHGRLLSCPVRDLAAGIWQECLPESEVILEGLECFRDFILLFEREGGVQRMSVLFPSTSDYRTIPFEEPLRALAEGANYEYAATTFRIVYSSFVTPAQVREYDPMTGGYIMLKQQYAGEQYETSAYAQERIAAVATDGTQIPISLVYRKDLFKKDGSNPLFLYGYGAYGEIYDPTFSSAGLSLLDRGFIFALAHVRGGGELGRPWYEAGKLSNKMNTFSDFISCMEHVAREGYTSPAKLVIGGRSAGGLLIGAVVSMRPDLIRAALVGVPFVDVVNVMMDPTLTSTMLEYEEWGSPHNPEAFTLMASYSPYEIVRRQEYPHLLVTAGFNDPLVSYWEPAKWVAKLRALKTDDHMLLLKTNMEAGHHGSLGRYEALRQEAFEYAFFLEALE